MQFLFVLFPFGSLGPFLYLENLVQLKPVLEWWDRVDLCSHAKNSAAIWGIAMKPRLRFSCVFCVSKASSNIVFSSLVCFKLTWSRSAQVELLWSVNDGRPASFVRLAASTIFFTINVKKVAFENIEHTADEKMEPTPPKPMGKSPLNNRKHRGDL